MTKKIKITNAEEARNFFLTYIEEKRLPSPKELNGKIIATAKELYQQKKDMLSVAEALHNNRLATMIKKFSPAINSIAVPKSISNNSPNLNVQKPANDDIAQQIATTANSPVFTTPSLNNDAKNNLSEKDFIMMDFDDKPDTAEDSDLDDFVVVESSSSNSPKINK